MCLPPSVNHSINRLSWNHPRVTSGHSFINCESSAWLQRLKGFVSSNDKLPWSSDKTALPGSFAFSGILVSIQLKNQTARFCFVVFSCCVRESDSFFFPARPHTHTHTRTRAHKYLHIGMNRIISTTLPFFVAVLKMLM